MASIKITTVKCIRKQDVTGKDEPRAVRKIGLRQEILKLRQCVEKLAALLRLALVLLDTSEFRLSGERLPDGQAKRRICAPLIERASLYRWERSCGSWVCRRVGFTLGANLRPRVRSTISHPGPRTSPHRLTPSEVQTIREMLASPEYRHVPTGTLGILAQRLGRVSASPSTWYRLVRKYGWRRPRVRVYPAKPKVGVRTTRADEMWHIDTTVIRLLDGTRAYLHAVIDNFSRRILAWRVADTFAPVNTPAVLLEASRSATRSVTVPVVLADAGVENVNAESDAFDRHRRSLPSAGLHRAEVLELDDRSLVAFLEAPVALSPPAR